VKTDQTSGERREKTCFRIDHGRSKAAALSTFNLASETKLKGAKPYSIMRDSIRVRVGQYQLPQISPQTFTTQTHTLQTNRLLYCRLKCCRQKRSGTSFVGQPNELTFWRQPLHILNQDDRNPCHCIRCLPDIITDGQPGRCRLVLESGGEHPRGVEEVQIGANSQPPGQEDDLFETPVDAIFSGFA
jgi:hypothetical protein